MKIKNLAFCGIMASILGVGAAYADNDATIIASKAYVDANDNLKENTANKFTDTWANANDNQKASDTLFPTMKTLQNAVSGIDTGGYTENALDSTARSTVNKAKLAKVEAIQNTTQRAQTGTVSAWTTAAGDGANDDKLPTVKAVTQQITKSADTITDNFETGMSDTTEQKYEAWVNAPSDTTAAALTTAIAGDTNLDNVVADTKAKHANLIPRNSNIQKGITYLKGNGIANHTANVDNSTTANTGLQNSDVKDEAATAWKKEFDDKKADDHVPTVAAVEARVQQAEANASITNVADTAASATWNPTAKTINVVTTSNTAGNKTDKLATSNHVQTSVSALKSYTDNIIGDTDMGTSATTLTGAIAELGTEKLDKNTAITASTDAMNIVTYDANGLVTGGKILNTTGLNDINKSTNSGTTCTAANPCVLTYTGTNYKWTNMDTDGLNAVADTNS